MDAEQEILKLTQLVMNVIKVISLGVTILVVVIATLYTQTDSAKGAAEAANGSVQAFSESLKYAVNRHDGILRDQDKEIYSLKSRMLLLEDKIEQKGK